MQWEYSEKSYKVLENLCGEVSSDDADDYLVLNLFLESTSKITKLTVDIISECTISYALKFCDLFAIDEHNELEVDIISINVEVTK